MPWVFAVNGADRVGGGRIEECVKRGLRIRRQGGLAEPVNVALHHQQFNLSQVNVALHHQQFKTNKINKCQWSRHDFSDLMQEKERVSSSRWHPILLLIAFVDFHTNEIQSESGRQLRGKTSYVHTSFEGEKGARLGDTIVASVKEAQPGGKVKKG
ncbi:hypothetical protein Tco_0569178 [Tanacetum coccineum]